MPRYGIIIETDSETAVVRTSRRGICAECSEKASCTIENALGKDVPEEVTVHNPIGASVGDAVEFDLPGHTELKVSLLIWGLPIAGLLAGAVIGSRLHPVFSLSSDAAALIGAFAGLVLSGLPLVIYDRLAARDQRLIPSIIRRANPAKCPEE